jgi:hypothetical protein
VFFGFVVGVLVCMLVLWLSRWCNGKHACLVVISLV